jgi:hypothetical protein
MGLMDRMKKSLERLEESQAERERELTVTREAAVAAQLSADETLDGLHECRAWDSLGEWVALTSKRLIVLKKDGAAKTSLMYKDIQSISRSRQNLELRVGGAEHTLYMKSENVDEVFATITRRQTAEP